MDAGDVSKNGPSSVELDWWPRRLRSRGMQSECGLLAELRCGEVGAESGEGAVGEEA